MKEKLERNDGSDAEDGISSISHRASVASNHEVAVVVVAKAVPSFRGDAFGSHSVMAGPTTELVGPPYSSLTNSRTSKLLSENLSGNILLLMSLFPLFAVNESHCLLIVV